MTLTIKRFHCLPCDLETFVINCIDADLADFGYRTMGGDCMTNSCSCRFDYKLPTQEVLDRYGITLMDYAEICEKLGEALNFGGCGWCS